jgi:hypothetical protein
MLAEVAYEKNCDSTDSEQCFRSGELILAAFNGIENAIADAHQAGRREARAAEEMLKEARRERQAAASPPKKGWFSW